MTKKNHKDGDNLPPDLNRVKKQIEKERLLHIKNTFELRCKPSVAAQVSHHESLALTRTGAEDDNERNNSNLSFLKRKKKNNMLSFRMKIPLHYFNGFDVVDEEEYQICTLRRPKLPFVEEIPRSITWVFTDRNQLMAKTGSLIGKKEIKNVDGEVEQPNNEDDEEEDEENQEETKEKKIEYSKDVDRFIWKIGQEYGMGDLVVQRALTKFLKIDVEELLGKYNELIKSRDEENVGEASDSSSKSMLPTYGVTVDTHFCRRCLIFGCPTHEKHQPVIKSNENNSNLFGGEDVREICSELCYLKLRNDTEAHTMVDNDNSISNKKGKDVVSDTNTETEDQMTDTNEVIKTITELTNESQPCNEWAAMEKDLYLKGVEIFGRNSCLITRNLLKCIKTCFEVYSYMREHDLDAMLLEQNQTPEKENLVNKEVARKTSKLVRKRLRKYALYPTALKQTAKGEIKFYQQYTPCTCKTICGDECSCLARGNCCEKYCGCSSKTCKNSFKGCNCVIGQCINRQCPCVASSHECDPDLCQSCRLGCGHGSLGEILEQSQCKNMNFLLKKQKRIMIAKSDVQGWGAFSRYALKRHEFIGEYTGELITHDEANERAKPNDHNFGSAYHFTLNQQLIIDAHRLGNKLRFLNHSSKPNCYAKFLVVRGDHRIGLYADRAIQEGEELFFDYCYGPGVADWCHSSKLRTIASNKSKGIGPSKRTSKTCI